LDRHLNIFSGIQRNWYFIAINLITITGQVLIVNFGGSALSAMKLDAIQWAICIGLGAASLVVGVVVRLIPNEWFESNRLKWKGLGNSHI
jgi:P-type Ca2+ transporter type 2C